MVHKLYSAAPARNMSNHGNPSHDDDNHASQHEYNYFLDKEIQKKLLVIQEEETFKHWNSEYKRIIQQHNNTHIIVPKTQKSKARPQKNDEFCGWCDNGSSSNGQEINRKQEKIPRLSREKESTIGWKDNRLREISYVFKHYGDIGKYIEQYRYEHTYNFGPLSREPIEITTCKIVPLRDTPTPAVYSDKHHHPFPHRQRANSPQTNPSRHLLSPETTHKSELTSDSSSRLAHAHSESNILDLAHKYKFAPSALKEAKARKTSPTSPRSVSRSESFKNSSRPSSGKANRPHSGKVSSPGTMRITPSLVALGPIGQNVPQQSGRVQAVPASPRGSESPSKSPVKRIANDSPLSGPMYTKVSYRSPSQPNGNAPEKTHVTTEKHPSTPKLVLAPNSKLKTLDLITHMAEPQLTQGLQNGTDSDSNLASGLTNTELWPVSSQRSQTYRPPNLNIDGSVLKETASILKEGTDRDNFKSLVSELSYLNINTVVDDKDEQSTPLDITGLTVSFAQKYDIRELGFIDETEVKKSRPSSRSVSRSSSRSPRVEGAKQTAVLPTITDDDLINSEQTMGSENVEEKHTPRTLRVQLERVRDQRREKQQTNDIHKKEIQWRISKMQQESQQSKHGPAMSHTYSKKEQLEKEFKKKLERNRAKVTFNIPNSQRSTAREIDGEVYIELPSIDGPRLIHVETGDHSQHSSRPASPGLIVSSPDKISIMRRYFMDVAEREGNAHLLEQLRNAPDRNFKPGSANDAYDLARQKRSDAEERRGVTADNAASIPAQPGAHSPTHKHPHHQRFTTRKMTRSKTLYGRADLFDSNDKSKIKDMEKLNKLKEIYLKQKENIENKQPPAKPEKPSYKASVSVLEKMRQGAEDIDGMWFDSTGRAYVSLATRYDPVRK